MLLKPLARAVCLATDLWVPTVDPGLGIRPKEILGVGRVIAMRTILIDLLEGKLESA
jgi:hypothetical protein